MSRHQLNMSATKDNKEYQSMVEDIINKSFVASMISMNYELGVLELLSDTEKQMTSHEIAKAKGLKERYVRESMNCLACAHVVDVTKDAAGHVKYHMTKEQGKVISNYVMIGLVSSQAARFVTMIQRFKKDGPYGLPFTDDKMAMEGIGKVCCWRLGEEVELILSTVPGIRERLEKGIKAIECGSGTGLFLTTFAQKFPNSRFVGSDVTEASREMLTEKVRNLGLRHVDIKRIDLLNVPDNLEKQFDFAFVNDVIHDIPDAERGLRGIRKVLKPGSYFAMIDVDGHSDVIVNKQTNPASATLYAMSAFHCVAQSYQSEDSTALGACWGRDVAMKLIEKAGFTIESVHPHSDCFVLFVCKAV